VSQQNTKRRSVLINPLKARGIDEVHRAATPLELFYDLIYVVAIASLAVQLHHAIANTHHMGEAIGLYLFLFFGIWWAWNGYTWFASGYDTDDVQFRLASFAQMIGVIIISVGIENAFEEKDLFIIMIGYIVMRIPFILMWLKVAYDDANERPVALRYAVGVFIVQCGWIYTILYYQSWYAFIGLLMAEVIVPYIAESSVDKGLNTKYHFGHIEERLALLTIIVLGESILASVNAIKHTFEHFSFDLLWLVIGSTLTLFSMWWLYFDDKLEEKLRHQNKAFIWSYGHYLVYASATAVGALIAVNVDVLTHHAKIDESLAVLFLGLAITLYLFAIWLVHDFLLEETGWRRYELLTLAVIVITLAWFTHSVLLMSIAFVALNIIRLLRRHKVYKTVSL